MSRITLVQAVGLILCFALAAHAEDRHAAFETARKLEQAGETEQAFLAYAAIPGGQHLAVRLGRAKARAMLGVLRDHAAEIPLPLAKAVEADLLLHLEKRDEALACCRAAAGCVAASDEQGWASDCIPADSYLPEPVAEGQNGFSSEHLAEPFAGGPGSHRDNWFLRRFIALDAWEDAEKEFARVWEIHRRNTRPYRVVVRTGQSDGTFREEQRLVEPVGFNGRGLQFALDYAFFLNRRQQPDRALALVSEPRAGHRHGQESRPS